MVDADRRLAGAITRNDLREPLRVVVYRMAETGFTRLPVVESQRQRERVLRICPPFGACGPAPVDREI